jgi:hypothetical protein
MQDGLYLHQVTSSHNSSMAERVCPKCTRPATTPEARFCGRCGTALPSKQRAWFSRRNVSIGIAAFALFCWWYFSRRQPLLSESPNFEVQTTEKPIPGTLIVGTFVELTLLDQESTRVERVVLNGRAGEKDCDLQDYLYSNLFSIRFDQTELKKGDKLSFRFTCGDELISTDVYTNRGTAHYEK